MGNWSPEIARQRAEILDAAKERSAETDRLYPKMERPCGTPGAIYTVIVEGNVLGCTVELPFSIETSLPSEAKDNMQKALHDAVLPIIETFYRSVWKDTIAGKKLADDPMPMPKKWEWLFTRWIKRCFDRGQTVTVDGSTAWNEYQLPREYRRDI